MKRWRGWQDLRTMAEDVLRALATFRRPHQRLAAASLAVLEGKAIELRDRRYVAEVLEHAAARERELYRKSGYSPARTTKAGARHLAELADHLSRELRIPRAQAAALLLGHGHSRLPSLVRSIGNARARANRRSVRKEERKR